MHPSRFSAEYVEPQNRLSVFFRLLLVIPHMIVVSLWGFAAFFTLVIAWFALVITGKYPRGLYDFHAGLLRQVTAVNGYYYLLDSTFPPFGSDPEYSTKLLVGPPQESYSRVLALFRGFMIIPVAIIAYAMNLVATVGALIAWFAELFTGKLPRGIHDMIVLGLSYQSRAAAYVFMIDDQFPPFTDNAAGELPKGGSGHDAFGLPASASSPTAAPPAAPESPVSVGTSAPPPKPEDRRDDPPGSPSGGMSSGDPLGG